MNRENAFTPGPWRLGSSADNDIHCVDATYPSDGSTVEICEVWGVDYDTEESDESRANARLIAAAPEMFEAGAPLGDLVEHFTGPDDALISVRAGELRALRAALAKATAPQTRGAE